jgi:hypothetical protein
MAACSVIIGSTQSPDCWGKKGREIIAGRVMRIGRISCEPVLKVHDETGVGSGMNVIYMDR